jgi:NADPH:quinone reductase-like Zn-dependent oxidoreductase
MTISKTMKAARILARGGPDFSIDTVPTPQPGPGQILVEVESAAVNFSDVKRRRGDVYPFETTFPYVPGGEVAGTVVAHGPGVEAPAVGTRVFGLAGADGQGGYAQYAVGYAATFGPVPTGMTSDVASILLIAGSTAHLALSQAARLAPGESVLVPSATGGVGSFLVGLARRMGAGRVIAAVHGASKLDAARRLGAHDVVDTADPEWPAHVRARTEGRGVDVALEASGGEELERTFACLASFGRLVVYGAASGRAGTFGEAALQRLLYAPAANQSITGFNIGAFFMERPAIAGAALASLVDDVVAERVRVPTVRTLPLAEARRAHELLESRASSGKLVLKPWA